MLVLLVATLGTSTADAQDAPLTGIESVSILFEELDQDDTRCGLSDDDIRPAVANAFREGDVTVSDAPEPVVAYVGIATTVREDAELCASDYHISLMTRVEVAPPFAAESVSGLLSLTTEAGTVASARRDHPGRVTAGLSELARDLPPGEHAGNRNSGRTSSNHARTRQRLSRRTMPGATELAQTHPSGNSATRS
jgi:hypothetical protein